MRNIVWSGLLTLALLLAAALPASAQTQTYKLEWTQPEALAVVQTYQYGLKVGTAAPAAVTGQTCVANGSGTKCTLTLTGAPQPVASYILTAYNAWGATSSDPLTGTPPGKPGLTITVIVTFP